MMNAICVKKLKENAILPTYGSLEAAGADLYACLDAPITIEPGASAFVPTGLAMEIPKMYHLPDIDHLIIYLNLNLQKLKILLYQIYQLYL